MNLKVWQKLALGFLVPILLMIAIGIWASSVNRGMIKKTGSYHR